MAFEAWTLVGELLSATVVAFDGVPLDLTMPCRHDPAMVKLRRYSQHEFFMSVDGIDLEAEFVRYLAEAKASAKPARGPAPSSL